MFHTPIIILHSIDTIKENTCVECIFLPWIILLFVYAITAYKPVDEICSDMLLLGLNIMSLAILYPDPTCFTCSLNSLIHCIINIAQDTTSICAFIVASIAAIPFMIQYCGGQLRDVTAAVVWTESIWILHKVLWKLL
jgi:hypothetical protein